MLPIRSGGQNRAIMSNALPMARLLLIEYCSAWKKSQIQHQMISANGNTANVAVRGSEFFPPDSAINATKTRPRVHNPKKKIPTPPAISISLRTSSSIFFPLAPLAFVFHPAILQAEPPLRRLHHEERIHIRVNRRQSGSLIFQALEQHRAQVAFAKVRHNHHNQLAGIFFTVRHFQRL